jgi:hypothetical protein
MSFIVKSHADVVTSSLVPHTCLTVEFFLMVGTGPKTNSASGLERDRCGRTHRSRSDILSKDVNLQVR